MAPDPTQLDAVREALEAAADKDAGDALPHLREAADKLTALIDESMAEALLAGKVSLRSAGAAAGLTENAVRPRLARTQTLGAYANEDGRVTAAGVERAKYDHEPARRKPAPHPRPSRCGSSRGGPADQTGPTTPHEETAMTDPNLTHLYFLLDRCGSMQSISRRHRGRLRGVRRRAAQDGAGECRVDAGAVRRRLRGGVRRPADRRRTPARPASRATRPRCTTRWAGSITDAGARLDALPESQRPGTVIVGDHDRRPGERQQGVDRRLDQGAGEPAEQRLQLDVHVHGADQDAVEVGASLGIAREHP